MQGERELGDSSPRTMMMGFAGTFNPSGEPMMGRFTLSGDEMLAGIPRPRGDEAQPREAVRRPGAAARGGRGSVRRVLLGCLEMHYGSLATAVADDTRHAVAHRQPEPGARSASQPKVKLRHYPPLPDP